MNHDAFNSTPDAEHGSGHEKDWDQADYPVLTDVLSRLPDLDDATQNETAWNDLEQRLSGRIQRRMEERIQFVLEEIIRQHLALSVQKMTGTLVSEIRKDLQSTLDVVVTHAVTDELHRLRQKAFFSENNRPKIAEQNGPDTGDPDENRSLKRQT